MEHYTDFIVLVIFCTAAAVPFYSYFLFPVILRLVARFNAKNFRCSGDDLPSVTLLISAYNEDSVIEEKIENCLSLDYPQEKLQVFILNDGSTDGTDEIVERYRVKGIKHYRVEGRGGKNVAINEGWPMVEGDIVIFSDANSMYQKDAIRRLVSPFLDERIGCVCGELRYICMDTGSSLGENMYWKYEQYLKKLQSRMGEVLVLNGSIFAIRRELFRPLEPKIANDFSLPLAVSLRGYSLIYEPEAVAIEKATKSAQEEFSRKTRIIARGYEGFFHHFREFRGLRLFQFISQKFLRWNVWLAMVVMFFSNSLLLQHPFFLWLFAAQLVFYTMACAGPILNRTNIPLIVIPYYFCMVNLGAAVGLWRFVFRKQKATWKSPASSR